MEEAIQSVIDLMVRYNHWTVNVECDFFLKVKKYVLEDFPEFDFSNIKWGEKCTLLHIASELGDTQLVEHFLKTFDVDQVDSRGFTPLMVASENGHLKTCELLISKGANVNSHTHGTALLLAVKMGHLSCSELLIEKGAHVNATDLQKRTALMYASRRGDVACCKLLIEKGADINAIDVHWKSALTHCIKEHNDTNVCKFLCWKGAIQPQPSQLYGLGFLSGKDYLERKPIRDIMIVLLFGKSSSRANYYSRLGLLKDTDIFIRLFSFMIKA